MKKIIPFKKEIIFDNDLAEITSISLEHNLEVKDYNITGNFEISGTYKMTITSQNLERFNYDIPFEISMDDRFDLKNSTLDIDDFYYEIINNKILAINIDVLVDNIEEKEIEKIDDIKEINIEPIETRCIEEEQDKKIEVENVFSSISTSETYKSYTVYIVRENDNIESILNKYNVSKEDLEDYNNIEELKIGDKLIIPNV